MTVKRTRDPAGLLPGRVHIELSEPATQEERDAMLASLTAGTPAARIERLRRHAQLAAVADELAARLVDGAADWSLLDDIKSAEFRTLYLAAAPAVIEKNNRRAAQRTSPVSEADIIEALESEPTQEKAAAKLGIVDREIRNRIPAETRRAIREKKKNRNG